VSELPRIGLISTPWPLFNRPSIQLGSLKAFAHQSLPGVKVDAHHVYLSVADALGYDLYGQISERTWLSESLYAALLYPPRQDIIARFWRRQSSGLPLCQKSDFKKILDQLETVSDQIINETAWQDYNLLGLSICYGQLTSSVYFIHQMKQRAPFLKIVVGGSACSGKLGQSLLHTFSEIDFVINGEGELPLAHLTKWLSSSGGTEKPEPLPGLLSRDDSGGIGAENFSQITHLDHLPLPDYSDYFSHVKSLKPNKVFLPTLPMEISRGCWWCKGYVARHGRGCAFCNLNLQWNSYRAKSQEKVVTELDSITEKYQILSVAFMDNLLPAKGLEGLFKKVVLLGKDLRLFGELRATTSRHELSAMASAGMREIQVGIEALSSRLLKRLHKGTTTIDNMEIMKNCGAGGMPKLNGNLILNFPGSDQTDVDETLTNLEFAFPFRPLKGISFWLGYGSPVWNEPNAYGLKKVHNHPFYAQLFPPEILQNLVLMVQGYHGGLRHQQGLWRPVEQKLKDWKAAYFQLHQAPGSDPILSYEDGGNFLIIHQRRLGTDDMTHRLKGTSRQIYLFCESSRRMSKILERFPGFGEDKVRPFLKMMVDKRLVFKEGERYLSLAVPIRGWKK
jgi:ribosomal peptide maturation radical SAM protein 1